MCQFEFVFGSRRCSEGFSPSVPVCLPIPHKKLTFLDYVLALETVDEEPLCEYILLKIPGSL